MDLLPLEKADLSLVELDFNGHVKCKKHGAMNCVAIYEQDGKRHKIYRCVSTYATFREDFHLPVEQKRINWNPCRAGCIIKEG